jgi:hypothetical protein
MIHNLGPVLEMPLLPGELVAVQTRWVLSLKGRSVIRVRLFGNSRTLGWLDAVRLWQDQDNELNGLSCDMHY